MKCNWCGEEMGNNYHDGFPLLQSNEYDDRTVCEECNNRLIVPIRELTNKEVRLVQFNKCNGDWRAACRFLGQDFFITAMERVINAKICSRRIEYDNIGPMEYGINPCGFCKFYDICNASNKGNQAV